MNITGSRHLYLRLPRVASERRDGRSIPGHSGHEAPIADFDLEALWLGELKKTLKKTRNGVVKPISTLEDRQKAEARAKVEALTRDLGYSLGELFGAEVKTARAPAPAKHRHPDSPALIWSGGGREPQWFVGALAGGKKDGDLAIS